jgi:hypothetical protein
VGGKHEIVRAPAADAFSLMDRLDEEAIVRELEGLVVNTLAYHFNDNGQEVWGLAKAGIDEACAHLARQGHVIRELELHHEVDHEREEAYFRVLAGRYIVLPDGREAMLDTAWGAKRQALTFRNGKLNPHWFEQGCMKAARNARARLIGAELKARIIALARETDRVRKVEPDRNRAAPEQLAEIRALMADRRVTARARERLEARLRAGDLSREEAERAVTYLRGVMRARPEAA